MAEKKEVKVFAEERKNIIVNLVNKNDKITVASLCTEFSVSPITIRKDLRQLDQEGFLKRTHGGALSNRREYDEEQTSQNIKYIEEKKAIAKRAINYIEEGDIIALDTGTTMFELAKNLTGYNQITVVTNDLRIESYLERNTEVDIIIAGDVVNRNFSCTFGNKAIENLKDLNVDKTFLAANGLSIENGVTTLNIEIGRIKTTIVELANEVILLLDSSKLNKFSLVKFADINQIDLLITDCGAKEEYIAMLQHEGLKVEVCD